MHVGEVFHSFPARGMLTLGPIEWQSYSSEERGQWITAGQKLTAAVILADNEWQWWSERNSEQQLWGEINNTRNSKSDNNDDARLPITTDVNKKIYSVSILKHVKYGVHV